MLSVRRPTSLFQTKKPGANGWPSISVHPVGSIRKQNREPIIAVRHSEVDNADTTPALSPRGVAHAARPATAGISSDSFIGLSAVQAPHQKTA